MADRQARTGTGTDHHGPSPRREVNEGRRDHSLMCVGHGEDNSGNPFWLMKNTWGPDWGENGFLRMAIEPGRQNFDMIVPT